MVTASRNAIGCTSRIIAAGFLAVLERGRIGEVYNIGGLDVVENLAMARRLLRAIGKPESLLTYVKDRPGHDRRYALNCDKIQRELGWRPGDFTRRRFATDDRMVSRPIPPGSRASAAAITFLTIRNIMRTAMLRFTPLRNPDGSRTLDSGVCSPSNSSDTVIAFLLRCESKSRFFRLSELCAAN